MPQCQFLFSAIFVFQKSYSGNILGIGRNKSPRSYFSVTYTESEGDTKETEEAATPRGGAAHLPTRDDMVWAPRVSTDVAPSPINSYFWETLDTRVIFHEKFQSRRRRQP